MKQSYTVVTLAMALGIMLIAVGPLGSVFAQTNTTANGAGNATGGTGGNVTGGATTASEIENLTQGNTEALTNNTEVTDEGTGLADLQKEQTSTDPNMTTPSG
jgi:hypothetical protein